MPWAPVNIAGARDGSLNLTVTWQWRNRWGGDLQGDPGVKMFEPVEAYSIDILASPGGAVKRTLSASTASVVYTAAQQITDFGSTQSNVAVAVYQLHKLIGRGIAGKASV